jgi:hypothetical protein
MAMLDKGFLTREQVPEAWAAICYVADSVSKGYVNIYEQQKVLEEEYQIRFADITKE